MNIKKMVNENYEQREFGFNENQDKDSLEGLANGNTKQNEGISERVAGYIAGTVIATVLAGAIGAYGAVCAVNKMMEGAGNFAEIVSPENIAKKVLEDVSGHK
jgi:hypothetical protein